MNWQRYLINFLVLVAIISLLNCILPSILCFAKVIDKKSYIVWLELASLGWFISAPFWFVPSLFGKKVAKWAERAWFKPESKG